MAVIPIGAKPRQRAIRRHQKRVLLDIETKQQYRKDPRIKIILYSFIAEKEDLPITKYHN